MTDFQSMIMNELSQALKESQENDKLIQDLIKETEELASEITTMDERIVERNDEVRREHASTKDFQASVAVQDRVLKAGEDLTQSLRTEVGRLNEALDRERALVQAERDAFIKMTTLFHTRIEKLRNDRRALETLEGGKKEVPSESDIPPASAFRAPACH